MAGIDEIKRLKGLCEEYGLEGREILASHTDEELAGDIQRHRAGGIPAMARALVTFATRKRLTSFVGRPDRLRRQAHPAQPSTPCIRLSRPWRSFKTSRMERVGKCAEDERSASKGSRADCAAIERTSKAKWPQGAAHGGVVRGEQRPLPPQRRQGRLRRLRVVEAAPLQGHVGRLEVRPHLPAFRLVGVARAIRGSAGRNIPRGRRPSCEAGASGV